jgi:hypothetical protein
VGPGAGRPRGAVQHNPRACCWLLLELLRVEWHRAGRLWALLRVLQVLLLVVGLLPGLVRWRRHPMGPGLGAHVLLQVLLLQVQLARMAWELMRALGQLAVGREGVGAPPGAPVLLLPLLELLVALQVLLLQLLVLLRLQDGRTLLLAQVLRLRGAGAVRVGAVQVALLQVAVGQVAAGRVAIGQVAIGRVAVGQVAVVQVAVGHVGQDVAARPRRRPLLHRAHASLRCCRCIWVQLAHGLRPSCRRRCSCGGGLLPRGCKSKGPLASGQRSAWKAGAASAPSRPGVSSAHRAAGGAPGGANW